MKTFEELLKERWDGKCPRCGRDLTELFNKTKLHYLVCDECRREKDIFLTVEGLWNEMKYGNRAFE